MCRQRLFKMLQIASGKINSPGSGRWRAQVVAWDKQYPDLAEESSLELSAKVNTGEMKW
jgi:hypothetical protein